MAPPCLSLNEFWEILSNQNVLKGGVNMLYYYCYLRDSGSVGIGQHFELGKVRRPRNFDVLPVTCIMHVMFSRQSHHKL